MRRELAEHLEIQSKMMKLGFKVYPIVAGGQEGKRWPHVILAFEYKGNVTPSKSPPFPQSSLELEVKNLYKLLYNKISNKL